MITTETSFYVRYAETDTMGIVHHASYVVWFEEGRSHLLRVLDADLRDLDAQDRYLAVADLQVRYLASARYGDRILVRTHLESIRSRSLALSYEILNAASEELLVTGRTTLICVDDEGKVSRLPAEWRQALERSAAAYRAAGTP